MNANIRDAFNAVWFADYDGLPFTLAVLADALEEEADVRAGNVRKAVRRAMPLECVARRIDKRGHDVDVTNEDGGFWQQVVEIQVVEIQFDTNECLEIGELYWIRMYKAKTPWDSFWDFPATKIMACQMTVERGKKIYRYIGEALHLPPVRQEVLSIFPEMPPPVPLLRYASARRATVSFAGRTFDVESWQVDPAGWERTPFEDLFVPADLQDVEFTAEAVITPPAPDRY